MVGGGTLGFGLSHDLDSHVYLINGLTELALVDAGVGLDLHFGACSVDRELKDGDVFQMGDCELSVFGTSGHCSGMLSYLMSVEGKTYLFSGDTGFHGGKILLINVYDCDWLHYVRSLRKLASLSFDALLPGHLSLTLNGGRAHVQKAVDCLDRRVIPPNIL